MNRYFRYFALLAVMIFTSNMTISGQSEGKDISITDHRLTLKFNEEIRTYELYDATEGLILSAGIIHFKSTDGDISTNDHEITREVKKVNDNKLVIEFDNRLTVEAAIIGDSVLSFKTAGKPTGSASLTARAPLSTRTMAAVLIDEMQDDNHTLVQTLGKTGLPGQKSIYEPYKDLAIQIASEGAAEWDFFHQWEINASADAGQELCRVKLIRHYYRDRLGITYYAPIKKRSYFQKAPALAMTWVGIEGKFNRPDFSQRKEWLYPNIDWVSDHLLPYAGEMIFQLDDNYPIDDPQYMRDISDYIRNSGLIPGIWVAPFGVAPYSLTETHPEYFIHKPDSSIITTFSGLSYDDVKHYSSAVLNVNNREGVDKWFAGYLREMSEEWNYDYFKVDGMPAALTVYDQSVDGGGVDGVRRGLEIFRSVVGPDKYINTCWGMPIELIDIVNGSRVGGDTEQEDQVVSRVAVRENFLNNVAWYSDPDGAANMYASTVGRARLNFLGRSILGQPYVTDDNWTKVPDEILEVWQKTLPTIESFPTNLYRVQDDREKYDHFDLKITKPWSQWDVVALNNYDDFDRISNLELGRLALDVDEVYVYDFWNSKYLGKYKNSAKILRNMKAIDAHCFSVVPVQTDRPVLISTSRHYTQGGVDLEQLSYEKEGSDWVVDGVSGTLVSKDPYELVFKTNGYTLKDATVSDGKYTVVSEEGIAKLNIIPDHTATDWSITFVPDEKLSVSFGTELLHVLAGEEVVVPVDVAGSARWKVLSEDKNIKIKKDRDAAAFTVKVSDDVVVPEKTWSAWLVLESKDAAVYLDSLLVEVQGPDRDNIAPEATASASSIYFWGDQNGYGRPSYVNDKLNFKAWEAAEGETDGWVEIMWKEPVTFQRIVIDEWLESGGNITSWELQAGHKKYEYTPRRSQDTIVTYDPGEEVMNKIASGETIGSDFVIELDEPVNVNTLRLIIHKATARPGVWDIEVNPAE